MKMKDGFMGERAIVLPPVVIEMEQNDPLVSSLYITDMGYYPHAGGHYRQRSEPLGQHVLIYCVEGAGWYTVGGRRHSVGPHQYFILPSGQPHAYGADAQTPWTIYWIHFTGEHAAIYSEGAQAPQHIPPAVNSRIQERNTIFEEIFSTLQRGFHRENLRYASSLLHYYLASMRYLRQFREAQAGDTEVVSAAIHYMRENLEHRITMSQVAAYTGYSMSRFAFLFRQQTGQSPLSYFNRLKMERACQLLAQTPMKVNQICHKVGIDDCYYFSRLFTRAMGLSPRQYRERAKNSQEK